MTTGLGCLELAGQHVTAEVVDASINDAPDRVTLMGLLGQVAKVVSEMNPVIGVFNAAGRIVQPDIQPATVAIAFTSSYRTTVHERVKLTKCFDRVIVATHLQDQVVPLRACTSADLDTNEIENFNIGRVTFENVQRVLMAWGMPKPKTAEVCSYFMYGVKTYRRTNLTYLYLAGA